MNSATIEHSAAHEGQAVSEQAWSVGRGQHVKLVRPGLRPTHDRGRCRQWHVGIGADDLTDAEFELVIALPGATDRPIAVSSRTTRSLRLVSEGVFHQRGRPPSTLAHDAS